MEKIRVLIINEYPAVCKALVARLNTVASVDVVASASVFEKGLHYRRIMQPDVILIELKRTGREKYDPISAVSRLLADGPVGVIVLSSYMEGEEQDGVLRAGASRYLLKDIDTARLVSEIEAVAHGPLPT